MRGFLFKYSGIARPDHCLVLRRLEGGKGHIDVTFRLIATGRTREGQHHSSVGIALLRIVSQKWNASGKVVVTHHSHEFDSITFLKEVFSNSSLGFENSVCIWECECCVVDLSKPHLHQDFDLSTPCQVLTRSPLRGSCGF